MGVILMLPDASNWAVEDSHNWAVKPTTMKSESSVLIKQPYVTARAVTTTMIVCGDCAGGDKLPRKTFLTEDGRCDGCGGHSFVLAVNYQFQIELARRISELVS